MELFDPPSIQQKDITIWTDAFQVRSFEVDVTGHLGITHLCNYLQEAAGNHARALGVSVEQLQELHLTWMLSRLHVKMQRYPAWRDTLFIDTWPSGHNGLYASREFLIYTEEGDQIGRATSAWLMIDLKRHRPLRVPGFIDALQVPDLPRPIPDPFQKMEPPGQTTNARSFTVGYHDLDINCHANNVRYISWALESMPIEILKSHMLQGLEVHFRTEARYGDQIDARARQEPDERGLVVRHALYAEDKEREIATLRTQWKKPEQARGI
jgi:acyl-ACP thioesterase